jgi:DNA-binding NtrC family response regulator
MADSALGRILVVDDESELLSALTETLSDQGFETLGASNADEGLKILRTEEVDLLLSDLMMPRKDGIQLLREAMENEPALVGIIMTGQGTISTAVEAMKTGAFDYLLKPFTLQSILPVLTRAMEVRRLRKENARLRQYVARLSYESPRYQLIGASPAMQRVIQMIEKVAPTDSTVLVRGASGTGKELAARALHHNSQRRNGPLVTVNCAALQSTLLESELFGHEKGSFTGATQAKPGLIEVAEGGTLFIDEVAEMSPALQAKLLRVLEDGHFRRVGSIKDFHADVRIVAATNKPLEEEQKAGRFREDLFYRLNVITITLPTLQERREDIPVLVQHFLETRGTGGAKFHIDAAAMRALLNHDWPGNIRELANVIERAQILAEGDTITMDDLPESFLAVAAAGPATSGSPLNLSHVESKTVQMALQQTGGHKVRAAELLGVSRRALYRLLARHGLDRSAAASQESGK